MATSYVPPGSSGSAFPGTNPQPQTQNGNIHVVTNRATGKYIIPSATYKKLPGEDQKAFQGGAPDEVHTVNDLLGIAQHDDQATTLQRQNDLVAAGLLKPHGYLPGIFDAPTETAYETLLLESGYGGKTPDEQLQARKDAVSQYGDQTGKGHAPLEPLTHIIQLQAPEDLHDALKNAFRSELGRLPTKAELDQFVNKYQTNERTSQTQAFAAQDANHAKYAASLDAATASGSGLGAETNPTSTTTEINKVASPAAAAIEEAQTNHPVEYGAMKVVNAIEAFFGLLNQSNPGITSSTTDG